MTALLIQFCSSEQLKLLAFAWIDLGRSNAYNEILFGNDLKLPQSFVELHPQTHYRGVTCRCQSLQANLMLPSSKTSRVIQSCVLYLLNWVRCRWNFLWMLVQLWRQNSGMDPLHLLKWLRDKSEGAPRSISTMCITWNVSHYRLTSYIISSHAMSFLLLDIFSYIWTASIDSHAWTTFKNMHSRPYGRPNKFCKERSKLK